MTNCQHDPTYRIENEANGGTGCPICNRSNPAAVKNFAPLRWNPKIREMESLRSGWFDEDAAAVKWSTDAERAEAHTQAEKDMARLSAYMGAAYDKWTQTPDGMKSIAHIGLVSGPAIEY